MRISSRSSLHLDPFPKESQEIDVESIVVTPSVSSSSKSLEFYAMVHQDTPSVSPLVHIGVLF